MLFEKPEENILRIYEDNKIIEEGQMVLNRILRDNLGIGKVHLLLVDLDGSSEVRALGINAKVQLVEQMKAKLNSLLDSNYYLIDSGTRDEMFIVLPLTEEEEVVNFAEYVRSTIEKHQFQIKVDKDKKLNVHLTVSIGITEAPSFGTNAADLMFTAKEALNEAKKMKNRTVTINESIISSRNYKSYLSEGQITMLENLAEHTGRTTDSLILESIERLFNKHKALWYWGVENWEYYKELKENTNETQKSI